MRNSRTITVAALLVLTAAAVLAGCAGGGAGRDDADGTTPEKTGGPRLIFFTAAG